jgi:hypothetical protein
MIPDKSGLSTADFVAPRNIHNTLRESYETGGKELGDISKGFFQQVWRAYIDRMDVVITKNLSSGEVLRITCLKKPKEIDLTFDQNMRPVVAYTVDGGGYIYYFNAQIAGYSHDWIPDVRNMRVSLDDKRGFRLDNSDVVLAYMYQNKLFYALQRNRFINPTLVEDFSSSHHKKILWKIGMTTENRFGFYVR